MMVHWLEIILVVAFWACVVYVAIKPDKMIYLAALCFVSGMLGDTIGMSLVVVNIADNTLYMGDILTVVLGVHFCYLFLKKLNITKRFDALLLLIFAAVLCCGAVRGIIINGFSSDYMGDIRGFAWFFAPLWYFAFVGVREKQENTVKLMHGVMNFTLGFCVLAWVCYFAGMPITSGETMRVIYASATIVVVLYTLYLIYYDFFIAEKSKIRIRTIVFVIAIVMLQHNSTWLALFAGGMVMCVLRWKEILAEKRNIVVGCVAVLLLGGAVFLVFRNSAGAQMILESFEKFGEVGADDSTFSNRVSVWKALFERITLTTWVMGEPFGTGYYVERFWNGTWSVWTTCTHNAYVQLLFRTGLIGGLSLLAFIGRLLWKDVFQTKTCIASMVLAAILVYWIPYDVALETGCAIGIVAQAIWKKEESIAAK